MSGDLGRDGTARLIYSGDSLSDASGILLLLISAKLSLETYLDSAVYVESISKCIRVISQRYNLTDRELSDGIVWKEAGVHGILRLLEYVEAEVRDRLHDGPSADELRLCIDRLANSERLSRRVHRAEVASLASASPWSTPKFALRRQ